MREAIGGTQLFYLVLIFLTIYIIFMAGVINYGRAFRQKNAIINLIEQNEGVTSLGSAANSSAKDKTLYGYAREVGYTGDITACRTTVTGRGTMYKITIYYSFDMPMVDPIKIYLSGETKLINRPVDDERSKPDDTIPDCRLVR